MKKLRNKRGQMVGVDFALYAFLAVAIFGAMKTDQGEWGKYGSDNFEARQAAIEADGGHINNKDRWYEASHLKP